MPPAATTYHAVWVPVQAPVTLDANGGTVAGWSGAVAEPSQTRSVAYGSTLALPTPTQDGQVFLAWCTSRSGTGVLDGCTTYVPGSMTYTQATTGATTLYAKWRTATFTLGFALGGGTYRGGSTAPTGGDVLYGQSAAASGLTWPDPSDLAPPPDADPYVFAGWYTTQAGTPVARVSADTALTWANLGARGWSARARAPITHSSSRPGGCTGVRWRSTRRAGMSPGHCPCPADRTPGPR
ncbi:InlB B-repeat-containing protein [Cellulomonas soli]